MTWLRSEILLTFHKSLSSFFKENEPANFYATAIFLHTESTFKFHEKRFIADFDFRSDMLHFFEADIIGKNPDPGSQALGQTQRAWYAGFVQNRFAEPI